jgi:epoxyqueuosine reductase
VGVDSMPIFERAWAQRAGLGFIGKNCCLIVPGLGSHLFLTVVVTSARLPEDAPIKERCGECTRCLDACPTEAFMGSRELDARRCISYLTIEQRGAIAPELMEQMGSWMFGCDVCQDVCPFNATSPLPPEKTTPFAPDPRRGELSAAEILQMGEDEFSAFAEGSPMKRPGRAGLSRNAAIVLGNSGDKRHLPVLQATAQEHDSVLVRETAQWAADKLARE